MRARVVLACVTGHSLCARAFPACRCRRFCRKNGIHVSPTVYVNGLEDGRISSGWTLAQWQEYLEGGLSTGDEKK